MIAAVFAVALLAAGADSAAKAADVAPAATPTKSAKTVDKNAMVCRKEPVLGSRMKQRTCMTQDQWDQMKNEARDQVEKNQSVKPLSF